ncbi:MAG TPA: VOC family protein [Terriglobales bacterium]|nr:VOC family protein [Terriglobales bacterium]
MPEERSLHDQLNAAIDAILARRSAAPLAPELAALAALAVDLRGLPRPEFKRRLKEELEKEANEMPALEIASETKKAKFREGFTTVTPYLSIDHFEEAMNFMKQAFGAVELFRGGPGSAGGYHAEVRIGDSILMIGGGGNFKGPYTPTSLHLYVPDADAVYHRAIAAGATSLHEPTDQFYGDREAGVRDVAGNEWWIATHKGASYRREGLRAVTTFLRVHGAGRMLDFITEALGGEVVERHSSPDGVVHYSQARIGNGILEVNEAHGPWQPMPTMFYLYVPDPDALYARAVAAGAQSMFPPQDQPYGDRVAAVKDEWGNQWYMGTPTEKPGA